MAELYLKEGIAFIRELSRNMNAFLSRDNFIRVCIEDFQPKKLYIGIGKPPYYFGSSVKNADAVAPENKELQSLIIKQIRMRFSFFDITSSMNGVALFMPSSKSKDTRNISYCNIPWNEILPKVLKKDGKLYLAYTVRDLKHYIANHLFNVSFGDKASSIFLPASLFLNCHKNKHSFIFDTWEGALLRELFKKVDIDIVTAKSELYYDFNISGDYILSNLYVDLNSGEVYYHTMGDLLPVSLEYATLTSSLNDSFRNDSTLYSLRVSVSAKL